MKGANPRYHRQHGRNITRLSGADIHLNRSRSEQSIAGIAEPRQDIGLFV